MLCYVALICECAVAAMQVRSRGVTSAQSRPCKCAVSGECLYVLYPSCFLCSEFVCEEMTGHGNSRSAPSLILIIIIAVQN